jgi:GrxC family glutaredoxin
MPKVVIYTTNYCPFCTRAKALLRTKHIDFEEIDITLDEHLREEVTRLSGRRTVPQIFIDGKFLGGFDDIKELDMSGELDRLLGIQS